MKGEQIEILKDLSPRRKSAQLSLKAAAAALENKHYNVAAQRLREYAEEIDAIFAQFTRLIVSHLKRGRVVK